MKEQSSLTDKKKKHEQYLSKAERCEKIASIFDIRAKSEYPVNIKLFIKAAKYSQQCAKYWELINKYASDAIEKDVALANKHVGIANFYKSYGNFYYYNGNLQEAKKFFIKVIEENRLFEENIPWKYAESKLIFQHKDNQFNLEALVSNCEAGLAREKGNWKDAMLHFQRSKEFFEQRLKFLKELRMELSGVLAIIQSTESDIQICASMIALEKMELKRAIKHIDLAQQAAEEAFDLNPNWVYFRDGFKNVLNLHSEVKTLSMLKPLSEDFGRIEERYKDWIVSMASRLFEAETERYLKNNFDYSYTFSPYEPPYLGKEVDVYACKGQAKKTITVCECKLRFGNSPLNVTEVNDFSNKVEIIRRYEIDRTVKEGIAVKLHAWIVTNAKTADENARDLAKKRNIKLKHAELPKHWRKNAYWKIKKISDL